MIRNSLNICSWVLSVAVTIASGSGLEQPVVQEIIRREFPGVSQIPPDTLQAWQSTKRTALPFLFDVREEEEYAVSHLEGATRALTEAEALALLENAPTDTLIVVYCSVGHRSSELAQKLMDSGFTNVHNLEGSIFEWANRGLPVYQGDRQVEMVHPFDEKWGQLLNRSLWATTPDSSDVE